MSSRSCRLRVMLERSASRLRRLPERDGAHASAALNTVLGASLFHAQELLPDAVTCLFEVVVSLQSQPESFRRAEEGCQPQCRIGRDRALAQDDLVDPAWRHPDRAGKRVLADSHRIQKFLEQHLARMNVTQLLRHAASVIVNNLDVGHSGAAPAKTYA